MTEPFTLSLPYPPSKLNPNRQPRNRMALHRIRKAYKLAVMQECMAWGLPKYRCDAAEVHITFNPPDNHHRDYDNAVAAFKAGQDGIAEWIGVDDSKWQTHHLPTFGEVVKGGRVVVKIVPLTFVPIVGQIS